MGSKNNPGKFDCYENAERDEPMFTLLGRDPMAAPIVRLWARAREMRGEDAAKVQEALDCADRMEMWAKRLGKPYADVSDLLSDLAPGSMLRGVEGDPPKFGEWSLFGYWVCECRDRTHQGDAAVCPGCNRLRPVSR